MNMWLQEIQFVTLWNTGQSHDFAECHQDLLSDTLYMPTQHKVDGVNCSHCFPLFAHMLGVHRIPRQFWGNQVLDSYVNVTIIMNTVRYSSAQIDSCVHSWTCTWTCTPLSKKLRSYEYFWQIMFLLSMILTWDLLMLYTIQSIQVHTLLQSTTPNSKS